MPWVTTKTGKHINTDWFSDDERKKQQQIEANKAEADRRNHPNPSSALADRFNSIKDEDELRKAMHKEFIPSDSYVYSDEYKAATEDVKNARQKQEEINERIKELRKIVEEETVEDEEVLTADDFDSEEDYLEYQDMITNPIYKELFAHHTDKGNAAKKELNELINRGSVEADAEARMENIKRRESKKQIEDFNKNWKSTVSENVKAEYEGFEKDTHTSYYQDLYKQGKAQIVEMSPQEYLHYCAHSIFPKQGLNSTYESQIRAAIGDAKSTMKLVNLMQNGTKMYMPALDFKKHGQEGRHRAVAAMILGIKRIPVMIVR